MDSDERLRARLNSTPPGLPTFAPSFDDVLARVRRRRRYRRVGVVAASLILLLSIGVPLFSLRGIHGGQRQPEGPVAQNGRIAFTLWPHGSDELIYTINPNGSGATRLSDGNGLDQMGAWSPDGTRIAFTTFRPPIEGNGPDIYLMNSDGRNLRLLIANGFGPTWSRDGTRIAFSRETAGNVDIYVVNIDGSGLVRLTGDPSRDVSATWSADGQQIAFVEGQDGASEGSLYVMNADGSGLHEVFGDRPVEDPHWSPTGDDIVFESPRGKNPDGPTDIYTVSAGGTNLAALTDDPARDLSPTWSPDGTKIAFSSDREGVRAIFVMSADGSDVSRVTSGQVAATYPAWGAATGAASIGAALIAWLQWR